MPPICACGCGQSVTKSENTYLRGHSRRKPQRTERMSDHLCECGCGQYTMIAGKTKRGRQVCDEPLRFVHGHNRKKSRVVLVEKRCSLCGETKPATEFYIDKLRVDGLSVRCKECVKQETRKHPARAQREKNPERNREYRTRWYHRNLAHARMLSLRKEARRRGLLAKQLVEEVDRLVVYKRDKGICGLCGLYVMFGDYHLDHVIPISKGGLHAYSNVQVAHKACNLKKSDRLLTEGGT